MCCNQYVHVVQLLPTATQRLPREGLGEREMSKTVTATAKQIAKVCFRGNQSHYQFWRNHQQAHGAYCEEHDTCVYPIGHGRWKLVTKHVDGVTGESETAAALAAA